MDHHASQTPAGAGFEIILPSDRAPAMGAHAVDGGVTFAVYSEHAERIELCLFDETDREFQRLEMPGRDGGIWFGFVPGLTEGASYGYRVHGPYDPRRGQRFNPHKLLIDPYARALTGGVIAHPALYGFDPDNPDGGHSFSTADSAPHMPKALVARAPDLPWTDPHPADEAVIYEAHVKGFGQSFPGLDEDVRGTFEAFAQPAAIEHLLRLGVTTLEWLPVHAFADEAFLLKRGLRNYWGYNTYGFFAPDPRFLGPGGRDGLRRAVRTLRDAGIEVVLDVVFNHTAESDHLGPTLNFRGLDNAVYYRLEESDPSRYVNDTGCGNTLNVGHPHVTQMVLDSLRHWVSAYGIAGFRFDLAVALGREDTGFAPEGAFMQALRNDPVLSRARLIAEPWDVGPDGYQLGRFPKPLSEWNDRFRDDVRHFWRGDGALADLATRLMGSADVFDHDGRAASSSVNFIAAHDGFTLTDTVSYAHKHNHANGEQNRDGHGHNVSDNLGVEGPSEDAEIVAARDRRRRNLMATLMLSQGTPMLLAGDEAGNSQHGNNNAYCQDNEIGWIDWSGLGGAFHDFVRRLAGLRRDYPVLRQPEFLHSDTRTADGRPDVAWLDFNDRPVDWHDPGCRAVAVHFRGGAGSHLDAPGAAEVIVAINGEGDAHTLMLPDDAAWERLIDTAAPDAPVHSAAGAQTVLPESVVVFGMRGGDA